LRGTRGGHGVSELVSKGTDVAQQVVVPVDESVQADVQVRAQAHKSSGCRCASPELHCFRHRVNNTHDVLKHALPGIPSLASSLDMFALSSRHGGRRLAPLSRAASTSRGLAQILEKRPDDVVITYAKRTAMGRRGKGQLAQYSVDEIMHALFKVGRTSYGLGRVSKAMCRPVWRRPNSTLLRFLTSASARRLRIVYCPCN
jgi:hypothetical protein